MGGGPEQRARQRAAGAKICTSVQRARKIFTGTGVQCNGVGKSWRVLENLFCPLKMPCTPYERRLEFLISKTASIPGVRFAACRATIVSTVASSLQRTAR